MPALTPTMKQGNIAEWVAKEGDRVNAGDVLAEIETDKATMSFEASEDGYLAKILKLQGEKDLPIQTPLCIMVEKEDDVAAFSQYKETEKEPEDRKSSKDSKSEAEKSSEDSSEKPKEKKEFKEQQEKKISPEDSEKTKDGHVGASPFAKKLAENLRLLLSSISGSGPNGAIIADDVLKSINTSKTSSKVSSASFYSDLELTSMRKTISARLVESKTAIPHYYLTCEVSLDKLLKLRSSFMDAYETKLSINDFIVKASALACKEVPACNSSWMGDYIREYQHVDVCIAVSTEKGLITPFITSADQKGLREISLASKDLAARARACKLSPHEYQGGTFTVSNLGMYGTTCFSAIINPPQSAILAVGAREKKVLANEDGTFYVADIMKVSLSCDHRVVDGAVGATWLQSFKKYIEEPTTMLL
ncbi:dihydrolipoyllysine-residue acetyltransferase component of pyruvate dehydrogenase complex, mitochondrial-like [Zophobas morio]|uniref:dihydrolipoyllysine-residue acetyltransferase component of pyruvate dehydrogenase complex, mitochondrial-like n=1 Tax=Zophobas morio TaxID=2755281 RepID=UPI0030827259